MYKITTKDGSVMFVNLVDALFWIESKSDKVLVDTAFVKISFVEDDD